MGRGGFGLGFLSSPPLFSFLFPASLSLLLFVSRNGEGGVNPREGIGEAREGTRQGTNQEIIGT